MVWFNLRKLEFQISNNLLSENDGYKYFLAPSILVGIMELINKNMGMNALLLTHAVIAMAFTILNIVVLYQINSAIDDKDFIKRYISVMWMVKLRTLVWYVVLVGIYMIYFSLNGYNQLAYVSQISITVFLCVYTLLVSLQSFRRLKPMLIPLISTIKVNV